MRPGNITLEDVLDKTLGDLGEVITSETTDPDSFTVSAYQYHSLRVEQLLNREFRRRYPHLSQNYHPQSHIGHFLWAGNPATTIRAAFLALDLKEAFR